MNRPVSAPAGSWIERHEFLLRRLHSLTGLIPVGAYMVVHLLTNASVLDSPAAFQGNVYRIHSLGKALLLVEWAFIFLPLLFHAIFGVAIIRGGLLNSSSYPYAGNLRYTLQRVTGIIAFLFIGWHVFHMHGWFHVRPWLENVAEPLGGALFRPYNASTSAAVALRGVVIPVLYAIGVLACVFHLANGIWTMGMTWGVWVSPAAQRRASWVCSAFGIGLAGVGLSALIGMIRVPLRETLESEQRMYDARLATDDVTAERGEHKRWSPEELESLRQAIEGSSPASSDESRPPAQAAPTSSAGRL